MSTRPRCARGHFIPTTSAPGSDCHCALTPRRRYRRHRFGADTWGQRLGTRRKYRITTVPITGSYL